MEFKKINIGNLRFIIIVSITLGVIVDIMTKIKIENISEFSLALIQIQATIVTLTLSIIGILSGVLSDQYMGVSISYYFLEINPRLLTHKKIIYVEFILLGLSLIGYMFCLYNFMISIFIVSLILIVVSITEIYEVFKGKKYVEGRIVDHVTNIFETAENTDDLANAYIENWGSIVALQSKEEFQTYYDVFFKLIMALLEHQKIKEINSYTEKVAVCLLRHDSQDCRLKGLLFVNDVYKRIREWIQQVKKNNVSIDQSIDLLNRINYEWYCALSSIDAEIVKQEFLDSFREYAHDKYEQLEYNNLKENLLKVNFFHWFDFFSRNVIYVNLFVEHQSYILKDSIYFLSRILGQYVAEQSNRQYYFDFKYWQKLITDGLDDSMEQCYYKMKIEVPEKKQDAYYDFLTKRDFYICVGYIMNNQTDLVIKGWFPDGKSPEYTSQYVLQKVMSIHFLMYYMIKIGEKYHTNQVLLKRIKELITEKEFIQQLIAFFDHQASVDNVNNKKILLNAQLKKKLEDILHTFPELIPPVKDEDKNITQAYFLYVVLTIDMKEYNSEKNILLNLKKNKTQLFTGRTTKLKEEFSDLHQFLCEKELSEEEKKEEIEKMISHYKNIIR